MSARVATTVAQVRDWSAACGPADVGLVPTMGSLHEGHLSLVRRSVRENDHTAASIFVNPSQFGPGEDLSTYPRDLQYDVELLAEAGCEMVLAPKADEMYPPDYQTWVEVGSVAEPLEGAHRPGHFRGVATVVLKLFGIFEPTRAYFGMKDAQQLAVVRTMTRDLNVPVRIVPCETVREPNGLAMSSRNSYLRPEEREAAGILYKALTAAKNAWLEGETNAAALHFEMLDVLETEPLVLVEYVSVADPLTMAELDYVTGPALLSMAVRIRGTRLIDNIVIGGQGDAEPGGQ